MTSSPIVYFKFATVLKSRVFLCVFLLLGFLDYSKAQGLFISDFNQKPLEGAVISISSLDGKTQKLLITNSLGEAQVKDNLRFPVVCRITMMGYESLVDTLTQVSDLKQNLKLTLAPKSLGAITVTGSSAAGYQANAIFKVDVISQKDIKNRAATDLDDLLRSELNIAVNQSSATGSNLSIQGISGENVKFLVDGVPVVGRIDGNIDLGQFNMSNIERVEIVRGPMSVLYGTDALGGVVNLITKKNVNQKLSGGLNTYLESVGQYNFDGNIGWGFKNSSLTFNGGRYFFDGWDAVDTSRSQLWKPKEQYFGGLKYLQTWRQWQFALQSNLLKEKIIDKSEPIVTPYSASAVDNIYHTSRFTTQLDANNKINERSNIKFNLAYTNYVHQRNSYRKNMVDLTEQLTPEILDDDTTIFNTFFSRINYGVNSRNEKWSLIVGSETNYETASGKRIDGQEHTMTDIAAFTAIDFSPIKSLTLRASGRGIYNSQFDAPFVPAFNILFKANTNFTIRTSWSMGFRAPSLKEQYLFFVDGGTHNVQGNPNLTAETSSNWLASVAYQLPLEKRIFKLETNFFYNHIQDKIALAEVNSSIGLYSYVNIEEFTSKGMEVRTSISNNSWNFGVGAAYTGINSSFEGENQVSPTSWSLQFNANADYTLQKTGTVFSTVWKYQGEVPVFRLASNGTISEGNNGSFQMMDVMVRQPLLKQKITFGAGVKNIFDVQSVNATNGSSGGTHDSGSASLPVGMGRSLFVSLSLSIL